MSSYKVQRENLFILWSIYMERFPRRHSRRNLYLAKKLKTFYFPPDVLLCLTDFLPLCSFIHDSVMHMRSDSSRGQYKPLFDMI